MTPCFGMPTWPGFYAWNLLQQVEIACPPVPIETLGDYLNLKVRYFRASEHFHPPLEEDEDERPPPGYPPASAQLFDDTPYWRAGVAGKKSVRHQQVSVDGVLRRKSRTVWLDSEKPFTRQRVSFSHECGHEIIPSHRGLSYLENGCLIDPRRADPYEREATSFGINLLMPAPWFFEDAHSVSLGLNAVDLLSHHYFTSLEATAIQYVRLNLHPCAMVMVEPNPDFPDNTLDFPLLVRYSIRNRAFQDYIAPGRRIPHGTPLVTASRTQTSLQCQVTGWDLGLRIDRRYLLDCRSWGTQGDVIGLIWQIPEGRQQQLFSINNYILGSGQYKSSFMKPLAPQRVLAGVSL